MEQQWYVIINPTSGNGAAKKKWKKIDQYLSDNGFLFEAHFTHYHKHSIILIKKAIKKGFRKIICVGGDGTLHNIVNSIMSQSLVNSNDIKVGMIPIGTGNDWVKTYAIPKHIKKAIHVLKEEHCIQQDIGQINLLNSNKLLYFNNLAGIGFDGYVAYKIGKYKYLGFISYLVAAVLSIISFKNIPLEISFNNYSIKDTSLMFLIGICRYSGGGIQLTKDPDPIDGLFDISKIKKISFLKLIFNLPNLFNGKIVDDPVVETYKTAHLKINICSNQQFFIQADGECIRSENFEVTLRPGAISFIIPKS